MSVINSISLTWPAAILAILIATLYLYASKKFNYWKNRGVPYVKPSFPFGNVADILKLKINFADGYKVLYDKLSPHPFGGIFHVFRQTLLIRDPETIKNILIKDFNHFHDRGITVNVEKDPLSARLFFLNGTRWKRLRNLLTPTFTSGKIKMMFLTVSECADKMVDCIRRAAPDGDIEIKDITARFTTDVIASCAFGIECDSLADPEAEFRQKGRDFLQPTWLASTSVAISFAAPAINEWLRFGGTGTPKHVGDFFTSTVLDTIKFREDNNISRADFMQMMIQLKNQGYIGAPGSVHSRIPEKMSPTQVVAQTLGFFLAGFETSSSTISYCLYELALQQDVQARLREEIIEVLEKHNGEVTYEAISDMTYLDMVLSETLRKYPPIVVINRECTEPYHLPDSDLVVEVGTQVVVPIYALHHDPELYPEPERFDPERFTIANKQDRHTCAYLPFGAGPRNCLGMRFGLTQTKLGMVKLLQNFQFKASPKTPSPLEYDPKIFFLAPKSGIHLEVTEITN